MHLPLRSRALRILLASLLLGTHLLGTPFISVDETGDYAQTVAVAKALAAENSWAKAREQYAAALVLAPDDEAKRWCELWLVEAEWRGAGGSGYTDLVMQWQRGREMEEKLEILVKPYERSKERDAYWRAVLETRANLALGGNQFGTVAWKDFQTVAGWLAEQPEGDLTRATYFEFLRKLIGLTDRKGWFIDEDQRRDLLVLFKRALPAARSDDDKGWCSWQIARLSGLDVRLQLPERQRAWAEALLAARGQSAELQIRTQELFWRISLGAWEKPEDTSKPDYARWSRELGELRQLGERSPRKEDHECADAILAVQREWEKPLLVMPVPSELALGQPLRLKYGVSGMDRIEVVVYRLTSARIEEAAKTIAGSAEANANVAFEKAREPVLRKSIEAPQTAVHAWSQGEMEVAASLPAGLYFVETKGISSRGTSHSGEVMTVGGLRAAVFPAGRSKTELFVFDGTPEKPVATATVRGVFFSNKGELETFSGRTDRDGRFDLGTVFSGWGTSGVLFVGERPMLLKELGSVLSEYSDDTFVVDQFLDRPIYRPGETVHWKLILRERREGRFHLPASIPPLVLSVDSADTVLFEKQPLQLDAFGAAQGEFAIPVGTNPAYFRLKLAQADTPDKEYGGRWYGFQVDNFVSPVVEGRVALTSGPESLQPGRELVVEVGADYFSGGPVVGAPVTCSFECWSSWAPAWQERLGEKPNWRKWADELRTQPLTGETGANGRARFTLQLPADLPDGASVSVEGRVLPSGMPATEARRSLRIAQGGFHAFPEDRDGLCFAEVGEDVSFELAVNDGLQRPAAFAGKAILVERQWSELWRAPDGRIVNERRIGAERRALKLSWGDAMPTGWTQLHAGFNEKPVAELPVRSSVEGKLVLVFRMPRSGLFCVRLKNATGEIPLLGIERFGASVLVPDEKMAVPALPPNMTALALPQKITRDGAFSALAVLPEGVSTGWINLSGEDSTTCMRLSSPSRGVRVHANRLPPMAGRALAELAVPEGEWIETAVREVSLPEPELKLNIGLEPVAAAQRPGEIATIRIRARKELGAPVPVALALAVADEGVVRLAGERDRSSLFLSGGSRPSETRGRLVGNNDDRRSRSIDDPRLVVGSLQELAAKGQALRNVIASTDEEVVDLVPFVVSASEDKGYRASSTLAGTRLRTELRDVAPPMAAAGGEKNAPRIEIRRHFVSTAFWAPTVVTDVKGEATVTFKYPDNLTQWRIEAYAVGADGNSFGTATAFTRTSLPFQARLNLPRFLVAGDLVEVGATLVNRTDAELKASAELKVGGAATERASQATPLPVDGVAVPAQGEAQAGWGVRAEKVGTADFTLTARAGAESDGMVLTLPVLEDGILQPTAASGRLARGEAARELTLGLPEPVDPARTTVSVQVTGSHAGAMLDALPYLVDYPYGCVEQTMSRFLPAVIVRQALGTFGFDAAAVEARILGKEAASDTARRAKTAGLGKLDEVIEKSLARLGEAQRSDGGFGWWPQATQADLWMTAYVAWGLELARTAGVAVPEALTEKTREALLRFRANGNETPDSRAWALASLAVAPGDESDTKRMKEGFAECYAERAKPSAAGRACLALASAKLGTAEERAVLLRNLENGAERAVSDDLGDTVHWGSTTNYWRASDGAVEATALTLLALLELDAKHALVEPAMNWLVLNRRSGHWQSTRDTAFAVLALSRFVQVRGEALDETEVEIVANGVAVGRVKLNRETLLAGGTTLELPTAALRGGNNVISLRRISGDGPAYAVALAESWATGDGVKPAGHQAEVARSFVRQKATPTLIGTLRIVPEAMANGGAAVAGEEVQAVVTVTVPNELEYVMVEVPKPAGCEPLNPLSGWDARIRRVEPDRKAEDGRRMTERKKQEQEQEMEQEQETKGRAIYREERDAQSVFFLERLEAGTWEIRFGMRAVTPGDFRALPVQVEAMYVPEIRANSDARRVRIEARK